MVYISSHNIISSLGFSSSENIENIRKGISGVKLNENLTPEPAYISELNSQKLEDEFSKLKVEKKYTRYEKLLILSIKKALNNSKIDIENPDTLIIISTTKGNINLLKNNEGFEENRVQVWKSTKVVSEFFKNPNEAITVSNACISGGLAVIIAKRLIDAGFYKNVVVAGGDIMSEFTLSGFQSFKAIGSSICKPFDKNRDGINLGEGAATIILTSDIAKASENKIVVAGGASSNDANHISGPSRTGEELAIAINKAVAESKLDKIDYISAHGTATIFNDEMESKAIRLSNLKDVSTTSIKAYVGHTLGAAGLIESIIAIESIKNNEVYKTFGFENQNPENEINIVKKYEQKQINSAIKTASGFGGCNAVVAYTKTPQTTDNETINNSDLYISKSIEINENFVKINSVTNFVQEDYSTFGKFAKSVYKNYEIKYPKYFKMDNLSKLGFLASDILLKNSNLQEKYKPEDIAIIISNGSSSLNTDFKYQQSINDRENYFPSPSVFVYTLANVMAGEICIRNNIKGENTVFISENFNKNFIHKYVNYILQSNKAKVCITGRLDYSFPDEKYEAKLYLIEKLENSIKKTKFEVANL